MRTMSEIDHTCPYCGGDISLKDYKPLEDDLYRLPRDRVERAIRLICPYCEKKVTMYQQYTLDRVSVLKR